jgi:ElaB/YqjD/DUF883 family membrane-anchored ribosome-binding protein
MNTQATNDTEKGSRVSEALNTATKIADVGFDVGILKKRLENAVDDAAADGGRLAKKGRHAVEDIVDDTTYLIKKNPLRSVGYAAGAGLGVGLIAGWLLTRRGDKTTD